MTEEDKKLISSFEGKLRHFMFLYDELKQETQYTDLKTARTISLYDKDIKDTKQRLASLVREVDRCIALLNE